jgi:glycosyltransferase involved in cell wall biosynthesis
MQGSSLSQEQSAFPLPVDWEGERRQAIALISFLAHQKISSTREALEPSLGTAIEVKLIGETLAKLGWQVDIFTCKLKAEDPVIIQHSPYCRTIQLLTEVKLSLAEKEPQAYLSEFIQAFHKFQTKQGTNYPLVHSYDWLSGWVALQLKDISNLQLIHTYHHFLAATTAQKLIQEKISKQADRILIESKDKDTLPSWLLPTRIDVIKERKESEKFLLLQMKARTKLGWHKTDKIILYVGQFAANKEIAILAKACVQDLNLLDNLKLVLLESDKLPLANNQQKADFQELIEKMALKDHTLVYSSENMSLSHLYYAAADVCVIPREYEPFGNVAIEAIACGTPVIASNVGGLRFAIIPEETGILIPPQDSQALANAIARIFTEKFWAKTENYTAVKSGCAQMAIFLSDLYRRLLAQSLTQGMVSWSTSNMKSV